MHYINTSRVSHIIDKKSFWLSLSFIILLIYLSPLLLYGSSLYYLVFDNLDSNVVWFKVLAESGMIFAPNDAIIPNMMGGLPRASYGTEANIILWLYYFFSPIQAYIINEVLIHITAYISMYIFLDRYLFKNDTSQRYIYVSLGSLYFSLLPFWPSAGLSIPLMPLLTYSLLRIEQGKDSILDWLLLVVMPLYSKFVLVYLFYYFLAAIYFIRQWIVTKSFNTRFFLALTLGVAMYLLIEYRLVIQMFFSNEFISNRTEYYYLTNQNLLESYRSALEQFINGVPHAKGTHLEMILPLALLSLILLFFKQKLSQKFTLFFLLFGVVLLYTGYLNSGLKQIYTLPILFVLIVTIILFHQHALLPKLLLAQLLIAVWFGVSFWEGWNKIFDIFPQLKMLNTSRFFFISQMLWGIIAALLFRTIFMRLHFSKVTLFVLIISQFFISRNAAFFSDTPKLFHLPFEKYYASEQFDQIKRFINRPPESYRVISLGIEPAVAQYNGLYTVDGYMVNYPLEYKHAFRKIMEDFLKKNSFYRDVFDGWGSKCYLFDNGVAIPYNDENEIRKTYHRSYHSLTFNSEQITNLGGMYLISVQPIKNYKKYGLEYLKTFVHEKSLWRISLYRFINSQPQGAH